MRLLDVLEAKCGESNEQAICGLKRLLDSLRKPVADHLTLITAQLPDFDVHDITHSDKMVANMEALLTDEQMQALDACELFLLLAACLLHDAAMALPKWEYELLRSCEGQGDFTDPHAVISFALDGEKPPSETEMKARIRENKEHFYRYEEAEKFVFAITPEETMLADLAKRAVEYVEYRNGFSSP